MAIQEKEVYEISRGIIQQNVEIEFHAMRAFIVYFIDIRRKKGGECDEKSIAECV